MIKRILLALVVIILVLVGLTLTLVGPWPAYGASDVERMGAYRKDIAAIDRDAQDSNLTNAPGPLQAGWAKSKMTPPIGTPLAGYGDRKGAPSVGVHDELYVKALALSDGVDTVVLVGSDMLIVPENVAELIRNEVGERTPLKPSDILLNASHSHSGPGGFGPGLVSSMFNGEYDATIPGFLASAFADAIVRAYESMAPARLAAGGVEASQYIRNRVRDAEVDGELSFLIIERDRAVGAPERCYLASFSAHPTILGGGNMTFSGDYPGYLQRALELEGDGTFAMYLGGATGSMSARAPEGSDGFARAAAMGTALADLIVADTTTPAFADRVDIASVGVPLDLPPLQLRPMKKSVRMSPFFFSWAGIDDDGWLQLVRVGNVVFAGTPCDFSGEISADLKRWGTEQGFDLWPLSFNGDYVGYISPDRYYATADPKGKEDYEMFLMSWCGPNQEAFFTGLIKHGVEVLTNPQGSV